jgi:rare lipoprotein A
MRTASGEIFRHAANIAAHPTWPLGTLARVTHLATGRYVDVRIMDRGPFGAPRRKGVIIDLSQSAARELDMIRSGIAKVSVEVLEWGKPR